ncbi:MAG: ABC transporter permease [Chloroflexi bacterium]|nr:ABC transporter permease [Chloroflexota bacterium]
MRAPSRLERSGAALLPSGAPAAVGDDEEPGSLDAKPISFKLQAWRRFRKNWMAVASLVLLVTAAVLAVVAPLIAPYRPDYYDLVRYPTDQAPSLSHWLGTDGLGRDILSRLLYGMRVPLFVAFAGTTLCVLIGGITGLAAALWGGWVDEVLSRITEIIFVVPGLMLIIFFWTLFGQALNGPLGTAGEIVMITVFVATDSWPGIMRLARGEALHLVQAQFVEAARVCGASRVRIVRRHLLPNLVGLLLVQGGLYFGSFIFVSATLAILGVGDPSIPDIGRMLLDGRNMLGLNDVEMVAPAALITALLVAASFFADGLRDAFDTRSE